MILHGYQGRYFVRVYLYAASTLGFAHLGIISHSMTQECADGGTEHASKI